VNRRRTAAAVLALSAVAALSACSSTAHPGAAAVVGDQRITVATLQAHVDAYRAAAAKDAAAQEKPGVSGQTLWLLVSNQVVDQTLAEQGQTVTEGQVQQIEAGFVQQAGSAQAVQQTLVEKLYLAPSDLDAYARLAVGEGLLLQQAGVDPSSTTAASALTKILQKATTELGVTVNPRYGSWDPASNGSLAPAKQPWLKAAPAAATS
jgi:hypothetical protein